LTPAAFLFGTEFSRETVRMTQQQNYERALRDLETELPRQSRHSARAPLTRLQGRQHVPLEQRA